MDKYARALTEMMAELMQANKQYMEAVATSTRLENATTGEDVWECENAKSFQRRLLEEVERVTKECQHQVNMYEDVKARNAKDRLYKEHPEQIAIDQFERYKTLSEKPLIPGSDDQEQILHARVMRKVCEDGFEEFRPKDSEESLGQPRGKLYEDFVDQQDQLKLDLMAQKQQLDKAYNASNRKIEKLLREEGREAVRQHPTIQAYLKENPETSVISDDGMKRIIRVAIQEKGDAVQKKLNACNSDINFLAYAKLSFEKKEQAEKVAEVVPDLQSELEKRLSEREQVKETSAAPIQPLTAEELKSARETTRATKQPILTNTGIRH